jgi:hypothetical protein
LSGQSVLNLPGQFLRLTEPPEGTARPVIDFDFFGADPGFAGELLGRHEEVEQGNQGPVDGGEKGLLLRAGEAVVTDIFTNAGLLLAQQLYEFFCSTKQLSFFLRLRVKAGRSCPHQFSAALLINSEPLSSATVLPLELLTGRREEALRSDNASKVHLWALLRRE